MRLASLLSFALCAAQGASCLNVLIGNDDSWGTANIRALYLAVKAAGHQALIAAPAMQQSGTDGLRFPPTKLARKGAFGLVDAGAPAEGHEKDDGEIYIKFLVVANSFHPSDHIWYINSTPASSIEYGLDHLATKYFGGPPDLVLTGVNQGRNVGLAYLVSGTYGAAKYAVENGIPAIAFSTENSTERVYTSLQPGPQDQANVYAQMAVNLVQQLGDDPKNLLPSKTGLNVNFPSAPSYHCQPKSSKWIITRILGTLDSDPVSKAVCMAQALLTSVT